MAATAESVIESLAGTGGESASGSESGAAAGAGTATGGEQGGVRDSAAAQREGTGAVAGESGGGANGAGAVGTAAATAPAVAQTTEQQIANLNAALRESRAESRALKQQLEAMPKLTAEQQAALSKLTAGDQAAAAADPDFLSDPKGYVDTKLQKTSELLEKVEKAQKETAEQVRAREENEATLTATTQHEQAFVQTTPDYPNALAHIRQSRAAQLQMLAPEATPQQIAGQIAFEERSMARQLLAAGKNPAEFAYGYAKTLGYVAQKAADPAAAAPVAKKVDKDAARTMGSGGGDGVAGEEHESGAPPEFGQALQEAFKPRKRR